MHKGKLGLLLLAVGFIFCSVRPAAADNWPRFRGPNGTGIANDKDIPVQWDDKNILWKAEIPGVGNSSPVVWGDHIVLQSASPDGKERLLLCLSTDGKTLWSRTFPGSPARTHARNTLAASTPATDGERIYTVFWDGSDLALTAFDFKGNQLWSQGLGGFKSQHGAGGSPIVYRDRVIFADDQDGKSVVMGFDTKTGKPVWDAPRRAFRACYATPFLLEKPDGMAEVIVASTAGTTAYNPQTGAENWHSTFGGKPGVRMVASPVAASGLVFVNGGNGEGDRHTLALKAGGKGDVTQANLVWESKLPDLAYVPCMLTWKDHLYYVFDKGFAGCMDAGTGKRIWHERLGGEFTASPILIDGKVYAVSESGIIYVFTADPTFKLLAKNPLGEGVRATPAVADNRLYIRGQGHLFCIGKPAAK